MEERVNLDIKGMHCPNCPAKVEKGVLKLEGVTQVKVDYESESCSVVFDNQLTSITDIINKINKMDFEAKKSPSQK